ncbi:hypothetical protein D9Q98_001858 [Chlorella vulgaris]|uniref:Mis18 domain-containing protein n=1 Tax=Chlorella vulgaris TaxID=3077 RepID=A0A9D4TVQ8_CHLVU|nr:hypothetical protein D9Q98_001858 [Chlorella vulgaris]
MAGSITSNSLPPGQDALVFQCYGCKTVLSDSHEFVCTLTAPGPDAAQFVAVRGVSDAQVDQIAHTPGDQTTYVSLCCKGCGASVGRVYTEVPPSLSLVRNLFCLERSKCASYALGSAEMRAVGHDAAPESQQQQSHPQPSSMAADLPPEDASPAMWTLLQRIEHLEASLLTLQGIQVQHDEQLRQLSHYPGDAGEFAS